MSRFVFQLHITGTCNCHCRHCYINSCNAELSTGTVKKLFVQYKQLLEYPIYHRERCTPYVYISGGEPFCHKDFGGIVAVVEEFSPYFRFVILSNGTILEDSLLRRLSALPLVRFQVSLDGERATHDFIRGEGNFDQVTVGIQKLHSYGIPVTVSFTANSLNYRQFPQAADICRTYHVSALWSDRYIPFFKSGAISALSREETREYVAILEREKQNPANRAAKMRILNHRSLQFLASGEMPYRCTAGDHSFAIDENGNMYPCRRYAGSGGNIHRQSISDIYFNSPVFRQLRENRSSPECGHCRHVRYCRGGARCQSLVTYGDSLKRDPGCWLEEEP